MILYVHVLNLYIWLNVVNLFCMTTLCSRLLSTLTIAIVSSKFTFLINWSNLNQEKQLIKRMPDIKLQDGRCEYCPSCKNSFRIVLSRIPPLLTVSAKVIYWDAAIILDLNRRYVVSDSMICLSLFCFDWGDFIDVCVNGYGESSHDLTTNIIHLQTGLQTKLISIDR